MESVKTNQGKNVMITVNTDQDTIDKASEVFKNMGLTASEAINIFLNECILYGDFPFVVQTCDFE